MPALLQPDHVTVIDNRFSVTDIQNLDSLPAKIRDEIKSADCLRSYGFQEICGYHDRTCMFSCGGYWTSDKNPDPDAKFIVTSYGSHQYQWDGVKVTSTIKVYV